VSAETEAGVATDEPAEPFDLEATFHTHYRRIARVIARVIHDPSRAEELAVDVFYKLWRHPSAHGPNAGGWLYRCATRLALDELRKRSRREKYERWFGLSREPARDSLWQASEEQDRVRTVLATLRPRDAQLVVLRFEGLSYDELAQALEMNAASIGTLLRRAQESFRKEYIKRYEEE
jgi:RNA polymerase sigma-70 factor (ECF subfamily)